MTNPETPTQYRVVSIATGKVVGQAETLTAAKHLRTKLCGNRARAYRFEQLVPVPNVTRRVWRHCEEAANPETPSLDQAAKLIAEAAILSASVARGYLDNDEARLVRTERLAVALDGTGNYADLDWTQIYDAASQALIERCEQLAFLDRIRRPQA